MHIKQTPHHWKSRWLTKAAFQLNNGCCASPALVESTGILWLALVLPAVVCVSPPMPTVHPTCLRLNPTQTHVHTQQLFSSLRLGKNLLSWVDPDSNYPSQRFSERYRAVGRSVRQTQHRIHTLGLSSADTEPPCDYSVSSRNERKDNKNTQRADLIGCKTKVLECGWKYRKRYSKALRSDASLCQ